MSLIKPFCGIRPKKKLAKQVTSPNISYIDNYKPNKKLNFISESKLGLSGALAHQYVAQSKPDGHVLGFTGSSIVINPFINTNIKYDILRDFDPIVYLGKQDNALVVNSVLPFKNVRELIDYSNKKPKSISYGHNGEGSSSYITVEDLINEVGKDATRFIMLNRSSDAELDFDFTKVKEKSKDNPLYYVQYCYARISSVFRNINLNINDEIKINEKLNYSDDEIKIFRKKLLL